MDVIDEQNREPILDGIIIHQFKDMYYICMFDEPKYTAIGTDVQNALDNLRMMYERLVEVL